jgi:hypothetical protein
MADELSVGGDGFSLRAGVGAGAGFGGGFSMSMRETESLEETQGTTLWTKRERKEAFARWPLFEPLRLRLTLGLDTSDWDVEADERAPSDADGFGWVGASPLLDSDGRSSLLLAVENSRLRNSGEAIESLARDLHLFHSDPREF